MSVNSREASNYSGEPVELFEFKRQGVRWGYSSGSEETTQAGLTFVPVTISRTSSIRTTADPKSDELLVDMPTNLPPANLFLDVSPSDTISLIIRRYHHEEEAFAVVWVGTVSFPRRKDDKTTEIPAYPVTATFGRDGLRLSWARTCPYMLYDKNCKVDKELWKQEGTISATTPDYITVSEAAIWPDETFSGGFFTFESSPGVKEYRTIESQIGDRVVIFGFLGDVEEGTEIVMYRGCKRTTDACNDFGNILNYGGVPQLPGKSPFDGDPVF